MKRSSPFGGRNDRPVRPEESNDDFFEHSEDSDDADVPEEVVRGRESRGSGAAQSTAKKPRRDKHAPVEVSSKKRPPRFQVVVPVPRVVHRGASPCFIQTRSCRCLACVLAHLADPRFEETSGKYNASNFRNVYKFLDHEATRQSAEEVATAAWMKNEREARAKVRRFVSEIVPHTVLAPLAERPVPGCLGIYITATYQCRDGRHCDDGHVAHVDVMVLLCVCCAGKEGVLLVQARQKGAGAGREVQAAGSERARGCGQVPGQETRKKCVKRQEILAVGAAAAVSRRRMTGYSPFFRFCASMPRKGGYRVRRGFSRGCRCGQAARAR